jgi:type I restriction enzyme S subunit
LKKDKLPEGWEWARLENIATIIAGQSPKSNTYNDEKDDLPSVRAPAGPTNTANKECCIGRGLCAIRVNAKADRYYLGAYFKLFEAEISKMRSGSIFQAITTGDIKNLAIPLPPFDEQKGVAKIIETKLNTVEKTKQLLDQQFSYINAFPSVILRKAFNGEL